MDSANIFTGSTGNSQSEYDNIIAHEVGHALGWVGHYNNSSCLMYPYTSQYIFSPQSPDKLQLSQIYAKTLLLSE